MDRNLYLSSFALASLLSLSARRAWIEIASSLDDILAGVSLSARRAWIEIIHFYKKGQANKSLSARRAWIEIMGRHEKPFRSRSLSARRAWIEIFISAIKTPIGCVALRKESVDRNLLKSVATLGAAPVALRKESVDRNRLVRLLLGSLIWSLSARRAWIEILPCGLLSIRTRSLSARRAWIEITSEVSDRESLAVALRKESVDRNTNPGSTTLTFPGVALRKESVDRNFF